MHCFVDYKITFEEKFTLEELGIKVIKVPKCNDVYNAINGHPDIQICVLNKENKEIIINSNLPKDFKTYLKENDIKFIESYSNIKSPYPSNISLNALITNEYLIHKINSTDKILLNYIKSSNRKLINIKQGYTKCSCLHLKDKVIITNDPGIHRTLINYNFDILLLPYGDIILEDFEYGFIGGVGGMISPTKLALFGNLNNYKYGNEVKQFLKKHSITPISLSNGKLIDRGSLLII